MRVILRARRTRGQAEGVLALLQVVDAEQVGRGVVFDLIELVDQQHLRRGALDDFGDRCGLLIGLTTQVGYEFAFHAAVERCIERGNSKWRSLSVRPRSC